MVHTSKLMVYTSKLMVHTRKPMVHTSKLMVHTSKLMVHTSKLMVYTSKLMVYTSKLMAYTSKVSDRKRGRKPSVSNKLLSSASGHKCSELAPLSSACPWLWFWPTDYVTLTATMRGRTYHAAQGTAYVTEATGNMQLSFERRCTQEII
jgi:hypothetical protein